ncbi:transcription factor E2F7-like isoform X2 [Macrosteles quadrilineatus]|uniref:transcription factor E2F7-like isoform X2 n=1 Tax=Macrosteles quadrilineatus TaxID=74068 RepID=UPI0023E1AE46|nr:transcription factor E2F7-like isoform X2 [Macrosteles quadrilineatus]
MPILHQLVKRRFLKLFPLDVSEYKTPVILLSDLAKVLGVEKRRIYDIINVVESLQMATKIGKNSYSWSGRRKLADILSQLKAYAEQLGLTQYVRREQLRRNLYLRVGQDEVDSCEGDGTFIQNSNIASFFKNERRIGILCQKFVMLFLVSLEGGLINLELAADVLVADDCQQNKTRLRRLYDIANILMSLGIITKLDDVYGWKKPVFQYVGPSLQRLDNINYESAFLSNLVKTELSDGVSSDLSEDSNDVIEGKSSVETDHSYSMDLSAAATQQPPAKKRLVFGTDNNIVLATNKPVVIQRPVKPVTLAPPGTRMLRLVSSARTSQPITSGGLYKALKIGNSLHFIKVDDS